MDPRERHFGSITQTNDAGEVTNVDVGALVRRLVLFEHCYLESNLLREIPLLLKVFGFHGLMQLLDEPDFDIICDAMTAGSVGQLDVPGMNNPRGGPLPLNSFCISVVALHMPGEPYAAALQNVSGLGITNNERKRLKLKLVEKMIPYPREAGGLGIIDYEHKLDHAPESILPTLRHVIARDWGINVQNKLELHVEPLKLAGDYRVTTNLSTRFGIDELQAHKTVERTLLGVAGLRQRVRLMESFSAMTGFQDNELPILESEIEFIRQQMSPDTHEQRFDRVVSLGGLPSLNNMPEDASIDMDALLELRHSAECAELRQWLRRTDSTTDEDISEQFGSLQEKLANITQSPTSKIIRFLATNAAGLIPGAGIALGPLSSLGDKFLFDKIIGHPGPVSFLSHDYKSIFKT